MSSSAIAVVGMAGRFPGARNVAELWRNLRDGIESIRDLSDAELAANGVTPEELANPDYVKRASILDDVPMFDAAFFGFSPRDASIMDPQHRQFLECAWEALEDAGHPPSRFAGSVGVFAGSGMNTYLIHNLLANRKLLASAGLFQLKQTGNDKDVLATRVSYQLDLRGPSINVQTACSTSLVAVHLACQSLLNFECDMALAGGVTIEIPHGQGYIYREGEILSRDGRCRSFDANSSGTVFASGLGAVVLRRLDDALADRDQIHAVILGSAINNDGARKVGYLAPSVEGQAEVIAEALEFAGVTPDDLAYIETHGTGTVVGDPIEVRALTQAFRKSTARTGFCAIGSLKSNLGHLDAAAGVSGLIKTVLALKHAQIPPSLHFKTINPHIEIASSPFYVNGRLREWPADGKPRRAGITSLGIGGTNAHVVLEEAPQTSLTRQAKRYQVLAVSAKTEAAADQAFGRLAAHLVEHPEVALADAAFTCQVGRHGFAHRRALAVEDSAEARAALAAEDGRKLARGAAARSAPGVVFLFSGQGSQYVNMGREMYEHDAVFRDTLDTCARHLREPLGIDLISALYPADAEKDAAAEQLNRTWLTQPALFAVEYALAQWWKAQGVEPAAMAGHSIGEYVAACVAGVFSLEDALTVVATRGRMIYELPAGAMLAVPLAAAELMLPDGLSLAAVNNPAMCVVSGPIAEIAAFEDSLARQSIACRRLFTSHAFHSAMMEPILDAFAERLRRVKLNAPRIPYLSNVSGTWITAEEATDPAYWARHIRSTVRFSENLAELFRKPEQVLVEAGPGNVLTTLARQQGGMSARAYATLPHPRETTPALRNALQTLGQLWTLGVEVDWARMHAPGSVQRVSLPSYPFERQRFWIEPDKTGDRIRDQLPVLSEMPQTAPAADQAPALYRRVWKPAPLAANQALPEGPWLLFRDGLGVADGIAAALKRAHQDATLVDAGGEYRAPKKGSATLCPEVRADYDALLRDLAQAGRTPRKILHLWPLIAEGQEPAVEAALERCFYSPLYLAQALGAQDLSEIDVALVSNHLQQVAGEPMLSPARAVLLGPARILHKELPGVACHAVDLDCDARSARGCAEQLLAEMGAVHETATVAYRDGQRFVEAMETFDIANRPARPRLERGGVYLITGGLGGLGLVIAEQLAREFQARLVLVGRTAAPAESEWESALRDPGLSEAERQRIRKLKEVRAQAGGLAIAHADIANQAEMRAAVALAQARFGKIDGVMHAAGVLEDGPLMVKSAESAARVLAPKVQGTLALEEALRGIPLRCFVVFSSISSIFPPAGQVDYAAANAFLDAFALSRSGVTAINWGSWRQVGMAARAFSPHPWLEERLLDTQDQIVFAGQFSNETRWALSEHRLRSNGQGVLPGTAQLEMVASAFARGSLQGAVEFQNVFFLAPIMMKDGDSRELRVQLRRDPEHDALPGAFRFSVFSRNGEWVEHSTGSIASCRARPASPVDRAALAARCNTREVLFDAQHKTRQEIRLTFGPRWGSLRRLRLGAAEALAEVELDAKFASDIDVLRQHPALLDMCTGAALYLTKNYDQSEDLFLPIHYKRLRVYRRLPARLYSHIRARGANSEQAEVESFDITVFDEGGQVLVEVEGFAMRRIANPEKTIVERDASADRVHGEPVIEVPARPGIPPAEGARMFTRILMAETPAALAAVPERIAVTVEGAATAEAQPASTVTGGEGIEATLAAWWQELLGVNQVGMDDDFFDLGGHSLVGVRLFAKIRKTYQTDLELAVLFEARTVRQLAALIRKTQQPIGIDEQRTQKTWTALVPVQPNGTRVPLFCVHAVGGDVLFYQQLARALGPDQPLYAFQSPLVAAPDRRDLTVQEMASLYIQEMRAFYPEGPYLLGAASYGGFVLYEMARQLNEQGIAPGIVLMFDVKVPGSDERFGAGVKVARFLQNIRKGGGGYLLRKTKEKTAYFRERFVEGVVYPAAVRGYRLTGRPLTAALRFFWVSQGHWHALRGYAFKPFPGKVTLIRATDRGPEVLGVREDPTLGWGRLALGGVEVIDVPTKHMFMLFDPYVTDFAETLKSILARSQGDEETRKQGNLAERA
ncbi:MAG: type I polyketide synthase [Acidobacteriota bacterium]